MSNGEIGVFVAELQFRVQTNDSYDSPFDSLTNPALQKKQSGCEAVKVDLTQLNSNSYKLFHREKCRGNGANIDVFGRFFGKFGGFLPSNLAALAPSAPGILTRFFAAAVHLLE